MALSRYNGSVKSRTGTLLAAAALLGLALTGCSTTTVRAAIKPEKDRKPAPEFALKDGMGKTVKLSDYKDKVVLLNFWATWCGPCKLEMPWFVEFETNYRGKGFAVLGVSMDEDGWDVVKPFLEREKVNYRVVLGDDKVAQLYGGVESLPTTFMIDRSGRIAAIHVGLVSKRDYQNDITNLLNGKKSSLGRIGESPVPALFVSPK